MTKKRPVVTLTLKTAITDAIGNLMLHSRKVLQFLILNCIYLCNAATPPHIRALAQKSHNPYKESLGNLLNSLSYQQKTTLKNELIGHKANAKKGADAVIKMKIIIGTACILATLPMEITKIIDGIYYVKRLESRSNQNQILLESIGTYE